MFVGFTSPLSDCQTTGYLHEHVRDRSLLVLSGCHCRLRVRSPGRSPERTRNFALVSIADQCSCRQKFILSSPPNAPSRRLYIFVLPLLCTEKGISSVF